MPGGDTSETRCTDGGWGRSSNMLHCNARQASKQQGPGATTKAGRHFLCFGALLPPFYYASWFEQRFSPLLDSSHSSHSTNNPTDVSFPAGWLGSVSERGWRAWSFFFLFSLSIRYYHVSPYSLEFLCRPPHTHLASFCLVHTSLMDTGWALCVCVSKIGGRVYIYLPVNSLALP